MKLAVNIKKVREGAIVPDYANTKAAGFEIAAHTNGESIVIPPAKLKSLFGAEQPPNRAVVKTGFAVGLPQGFELQVRPLRELAINFGIQVSVGTIGADDTNEVEVIVFNFGSEPFTIEHGDVIAQGVINRVEQAGFFEVDELEE
jgi:dUTP pyrophosphatase